jgi:1-acyl-sn-glycerol-3-phosphate acyltransferase
MAARALLQLLAVPAATLVLGLAVILLCPFERSGRLFLGLARAWCRVLCRAAGVRVEVRGQARVRGRQPVVFVSNHASHFDPPALLLAIPVDVRIVAKRSLFLIPVFGQALWAAGIIPINRHDRERAIVSMQRAADRLRTGNSILVFPEGSRSRDGRLQPFKKGAFVTALQAQVPIQPVTVSGSREILPRGAIFARPGTVRVTFLESLATAGLTAADRDWLMQAVAQRMHAGLAGLVPAREGAG